MKGFTLIELSIVIVVLGLIVGAVLVLQDVKGSHNGMKTETKEVKHDC